MNRQPAVQTAALVLGLILLVVGVLGFLPFAHMLPFGLGGGGALHNVAHILIGIAGLAAAASVSNSRTYGQVAGAILLLSGILGIVGPRLFSGSDIGLHLVGGAILAYFGFLAPVVMRR